MMIEKSLKAIDELGKFNDASKLAKTPLHKAVEVAEGLEVTGEKLWREFGYINPKYPTYESLKPDYKKCWILFAKKLSGKGD